MQEILTGPHTARRQSIDGAEQLRVKDLLRVATQYPTQGRRIEPILTAAPYYI